MQSAIQGNGAGRMIAKGMSESKGIVRTGYRIDLS
jgi:hypothetical protein